MAEFEVGCEFEALGRRDVSEGCEDHVGNWSPGEDTSADQLAYEVDAALLVGDGHDDANGDEESRADAECEKKAVPREVDGVVLDNVHADGGHCGSGE